MPLNQEVANRILNCLPSRDIQKNWTFDHAVASNLTSAPAALPAAVDLREAWWSIGDQMDSGSCVGWGVADGVCRWHFVKKGMLAKEEKLSVRYPWMAAKETDVYTSYPTTFLEFEGTWITAVLDIARKLGLVTDALLPFRLPDSSGKLILEKLYRDGYLQDFFAMASQRKIASYYNLGTDLNKWKTWLATTGPIATRLDVDPTWDNAKATKGNLDVYKPPGRGGHCVALVGYTSDRFIVRNSWGTGWGDNGFGYASMAYAKAAFTEAYGVVV